jgi:hypothetical protein
VRPWFSFVALAFSVHDEDSVYLAGGGPHCIDFRLILGPAAFGHDISLRQLAWCDTLEANEAPLSLETSLSVSV